MKGDLLSPVDMISEAWLMHRSIVWDPSATGHSRYTHWPTGRAVVRQPHMTDAQWLAAKIEFGTKVEKGEL
jgi:hypothetical protein